MDPDWQGNREKQTHHGGVCQQIIRSRVAYSSIWNCELEE